jgi:hypothetical protein
MKYGSTSHLEMVELCKFIMQIELYQNLNHPPAVFYTVSFGVAVHLAHRKQGNGWTNFYRRELGLEL